MQMIPTWKSEPMPAFINIIIVGETDLSGQIHAEFNINGQIYALMVDADLIDQTSKKMPVLIIADVGTNKYLVDLPGESLSAGSRILVGAEDLKGINGQ